MKASEDSFQLPPFPAFPCVSRYVPVGSVAEAVDRICRSIKSSDGISLLVGPPGTGKSLICRMLAEQFGSSHNVVVLGDAPIEDSSAFYRHLLHHLGVDLDEVSQGDLHLALIDSVCDKKAAESGLLIVVDEAQGLALEVLEAIRMATNIMRDDQPRVTALVCGGVKLDETLAAPTLEPFTQRVSTRCYLHPMNAAETRQYIHETIRACDADPDETITDEALGAIHHACSGVPRLINQIMTEAIDCAADNDQNHICERVVDQAWAQLQQLPSPMVEEPKIAHNVAPIEFGALSDVDSFEPNDQADQAGDVGSYEPVAGNNSINEAAVSSESHFADEHADAQSAFEEADDLMITAEAQLSYESTTEPDSAATTDRTVEWSDEPTIQDTLEVAPGSFRDVPAPRALPAELFGEFEIEETVPVGNGVIASPPVNEAPLDLESMIHSEIVSLSEVAAEARYGCVDTEVHEVAAMEMDHQPAIWMDEPTPGVVQAMESPDGAHDMNVVLDKPIDLDACPDHDDIVLSSDRKSDDSDLLVIEDEVDIAPQPTLARVDNREETVTIDFRAMLSNMRQS